MRNNKYNRGISILEVLLSIIIISIVLVLLFGLLGQVKNESVRNNISSTYIMEQSLLNELITNDILDYGIRSISSCNMTSLRNVYDVKNKYSSNSQTDEGNYSRCIRIEFAKNRIEATTAYILIYKYYTKYEVNENDEVVGKQESDGEQTTAWAIEYIKGRYTNPASGSNCYYNFLPNNNRNDNLCDKNDESNKYRWVRTYDTLRVLPDSLVPTVSPSAEDTIPTVNYSNNNDQNRDNYGDLIIPIKNSDGERYDLSIPFTFNSSSNFICKQAFTSGLQPKTLNCNIIA